MLLPGGRVKYVRVMGNVVTDPMGRQLEVFGAVSDVTDRVRAAAALQASERLARGQLNALTSVLSTFADDCDEDLFWSRFCGPSSPSCRPTAFACGPRLKGRAGSTASPNASMEPSTFTRTARGLAASHGAGFFVAESPAPSGR